MLSLGNLSTHVQFNTLLQNPQQFSSKPQFLFFTHINSNVKIRSGFCLKSLKAKKNVDFSEIVMDGSDEFLDNDDEFLDDGVIVPLENMKKWVENKPLGFGEGKDYDTSIEDKLMEEIEQSKTAQLANVNKLKHNPLKPGSGKEIGQKDKGPVNIPEGFGIRLVNLPKKKNIHKDLRLAFQGVPGLLNIVPVVAGNEKTRDPVCKGLAFVYFKSQDEARRPSSVKLSAVDTVLLDDDSSPSTMVDMTPTLLRPGVVVYDGVCHLCHSGVKWIIQADKDKKIKFCCLQSQAAEPYMRVSGLDSEGVLRHFLFVEGPDLYHQGSDAALKVLSYLPMPYSALSALRIIPTPLRDAVYDYVAKRRYDWFGKDDDCLVLNEIELLERGLLIGKNY